uniref:DJ-1/PfpI domain-containing protein n=1 Tax=Lotharella globosa TaxID=91324 RepID=A0A7S3Z2F6_9EUKA
MAAIFSRSGDMASSVSRLGTSILRTNRVASLSRLSRRLHHARLVSAGATISASTPDAKRVLVCIADGSEEIETSGIYDTLIRGGVDARLVKVGGDDKADLKCKMSRGMTFVADSHLDDLSEETEPFDMVVLPGGLPGAQAFASSPRLLSMLKDRKDKGQWYAAICASPAVVLEPNGLLPSKATCFPGLQDKIASQLSNDPSASRVVIDSDSKVVTSQGPGTTMEFGVELLSILVGDEKADEVAKGLLIKRAAVPA